MTVGDAVIADESIFGKDGGKAEVVGAGVVVGQLALVAVGRVDIKSPRLQGLAQPATPQLGVPLKHQATVNAQGWHQAAGTGSTAWQRGIELVAGAMQLKLRCHKATRQQPGS